MQSWGCGCGCEWVWRCGCESVVWAWVCVCVWVRGIEKGTYTQTGTHSHTDTHAPTHTDTQTPTPSFARQLHSHICYSVHTPYGRHENGSDFPIYDPDDAVFESYADTITQHLGRGWTFEKAFIVMYTYERIATFWYDWSFSCIL